MNNKLRQPHKMEQIQRLTGNAGLQAFGYEPMRPLSNQGDPPVAPRPLYINPLSSFGINVSKGRRGVRYCSR